MYLYIQWWYRECWRHTICQTSNNCAPYWFASKSFRIQNKEYVFVFWDLSSILITQINTLLPSANELILKRMFSATEFPGEAVCLLHKEWKSILMGALVLLYLMSCFLRSRRTSWLNQIFMDPFLGHVYIRADGTRNVAINWFRKLVKKACKTVL